MAVLIDNSASYYVAIPCEHYNKIQFQDKTYANTITVRDFIKNTIISTISVPHENNGWSSIVDISSASVIAIPGNPSGMHWIRFRFVE